ncbi:hypothetical protein PCASD_25768 [Puccinia coronata f. sp. avenae]|uniref:DDE Tnp4 domain-containing protein n=1 Tax=Puccinia coronata f. sp. avenae TaxID=200324 RepID=A0A2N5TMS4_9BASI|nr:hypothetical protein PCASD_25768 [Puccinia coronata f. sp. avenae]
MRQLSRRQDLLRDLFFLYMMAFDDDLEAEITHQKKKKLGNNGAEIFQAPSYIFKQTLCTSKDGFLFVLRQIEFHDVFAPRGIRPQLPVAHQLALTLERLGSCGNSASVGQFSRNLNVAAGTVIKVTRCVLEALVSLAPTFLKWPDSDRRAEISAVMKNEGFEGCVGFVDGTTFPIFQRPGKDGEVFFDRKKSFVFKKMKLHNQPAGFFDQGQYLLADSAYKLSQTVVPAYKAPAAYQQANSEFNFHLAKSRVRNEHCIGTAGINRSNTAVRAVLEQPCSTGGRTGTVRPKHLPAGRTGLSDQFLGPVAQDQPGPVGQICPTSWLLLQSDSARPTTGRTRLFEHRSNCRVRPVNAGSAVF